MSTLSSDRQQIYTQLLQDFDKVKARNLSLNIARGKPSKEQLEHVHFIPAHIQRL